jgi:aryl-alcohol dehydrogenase-like predicted oxidoreductase
MLPQVLLPRYDIFVQRRRFGSTDLEVSLVGLGCARIGGIFQGGQGGFVDLLSAALDLGINFFDTADMYSQGESETLLGKAFRGRRDKVILASKAGYALPAQRKLIARIKPIARPIIKMLGLKRDKLPAAVLGAPTQDFSPAYLRRAIEGSLKRLGTDHLDLYQLHSPPAERVRAGDWVEALESLKRQGKIRWYGVSCDTADAALAALGFSGVSSLQIPMSLLDHAIADEVLPRVREKKTAVIARECLANGLLAKDLSKLDLAKYCQSPQEVELRKRQLAEYGKIAQANGCTLLRLGLEYVMRAEGVSVSLIGASSVAQLTETVRQLDKTPAVPEALRAAQAAAIA